VAVVILSGFKTGAAQAFFCCGPCLGADIPALVNNPRQIDTANSPAGNATHNRRM
jgi:hypothetical protein